MVVFGLAVAAGAAMTGEAAADAVAAPVVATPVSAPVIVGTDGNGQTQTLTVGQELAVALPDNPVSGYIWQLRDVDQHVLHQEGDPQFRANGGGLGAPGTMVWTFTAAAPGSTRVTLASVRPGQPGAPFQQFTLTVQVR
jgi:inhibitor of cysteine peptidase